MVLFFMVLFVLVLHADCFEVVVITHDFRKLW